jgi:putative hemolysin
MTTTKFSVPIFLILALFLVAAYFAVAMPNDHAFERHGVAAWDASYCFEHGKIAFSRIDPRSHRRMDVCVGGDGKFFIGIFEQNGDTVTMYPKEMFTKICDVVKYVLRSGFTMNP